MLAADSLKSRACAQWPRETYTSLGVPIEATLKAVKAMKRSVTQRLAADGRPANADVYWTILFPA